MASISAEAAPTPSPPLAGDRYTVFHLVLQLAVGTLFFFGHELDRVLNLYLLVVPILILPAVIVAGIWLFSVIANAIRRRWRRLASAIAAPVVVLLLLASLSRLQIDSAWVHFQVAHRDYEKSLESITKPHPWHVTWNWGETGGAAVANIFHVLHYDETDLTMRRNGERVDGGVIEVRDFGDHFYLVTTVYQ